MSRDDALLLDILLAARDALEITSGLDAASFEASRLHQNAVVRSLEVIGEAAGKLSVKFRLAHPALPWRDIVNMGHRLIHGYGDVRLDIVWNVARTRLPELVAAIEPLAPPENP